MLQTLRHDLRYALRQFRKQAGFTLTAAGVFAVCIAAATAIFVFVYAALLKPLPYRDPAQLVALFEHIPVGDRFHLSYGDYLDWKHLNRSFSSLEAYRAESLTLKTASETEIVNGVAVSDGFFRTLGVAPMLGRDFRPGEDLPSAPQTALLSYKLWQLRYAADPGILGRTLDLDGAPTQIIGVLPSGFHFSPVGSADYWKTLHWRDEDLRVGSPFYGIARLKPGVSIAAALADVDAIAHQIAVANPKTNRDRSATVIPLTEAVVGNIRPTLLALLAAAGLLSLVGFVNIASLLLVRSAARRRETAIRTALGAGRLRIVGQFTVEAFLLAAVGCLIGLLLAGFAVSALARLIPPDLLNHAPYFQSLHLGLPALVFAVLLSSAAAVLFAATPSLQLLLTENQAALTEGGRSSASLVWRRLGSGLVSAELAITVVLLASAGLLAKSFYRLLHEDIGIASDHLAVMEVVDPNDSTDTQAINRERQILRELASLPGVTAVALSEKPVVDGGESYLFSFEHFRVPGRAYVTQGDEGIRRRISVGYFETLHARLLQGRFFTDADDREHPRVALINRTLARQVFAGEDPVGKILTGEFQLDQPVQVIGVVEDIKDGPLDSQEIGAVYTPLNQDASPYFFVTLRAAGAEQALLSAMRNVIHRVDRSLVIQGQDTMTSRIDRSEAAYLHRSVAWIAGGFASLALLLGTVGLYGVIAYSVSQRTREIGVRMALGAQRSRVYRLIMLESFRLTAFGVGAGVLCSLALTGLLRKMLYGVGPWDMGVMLTVVCVMAAASLHAAFLPARRAASVDPNQALRAE